jgi:hypothetical protein
MNERHHATIILSTASRGRQIERMSISMKWKSSETILIRLEFHQLHPDTSPALLFFQPACFAPALAFWVVKLLSLPFLSPSLATFLSIFSPHPIFILFSSICPVFIVFRYNYSIPASATTADNGLLRRSSLPSRPRSIRSARTTHLR